MMQYLVKMTELNKETMKENESLQRQIYNVNVQNKSTDLRLNKVILQRNGLLIIFLMSTSILLWINHKQIKLV